LPRRNEAVDAAAAEKIVAALDAELARRQTKKDAAEARWEAEFDGDAAICLRSGLSARRLG
jgi:hypothetical protein